MSVKYFGILKIYIYYFSKMYVENTKMYVKSIRAIL